jgi:NAD-dependent SIR2 family protein deacetylase
MSNIADLANLIKALRTENKRFVLMLGAGASVSSQVPDTRTMMKSVVDQYAAGIDGDVEDRFDRLMSGPEDNRRTILKPFLDKEPSLGYRLLAELIRDGYFDTVITFNFDVLLERSLHEIGVHDFQTIVRGEYKDEQIPLVMDQPGIKILKLHGSLKGTSAFVFTRDGLIDYPEPIQATMRKLTACDILVCGYAYNDQCVIRSFSDNGRGTVVIVNKNPPPMLRDIAKHRNSEQYLYSGESGYFDQFFETLSASLKPDGQPVKAVAKNPFKFLEAYRAQDEAPEDRNWFFGRDQLVQEFSQRLRDQPPRALFIAGPSKAGKTSFVRAGLMPVLEPQPLYLRCQSDQDFETWLASELARRHDFVPANDLGAALQALAPAAGPRFYLVLDQFERVVRPYDRRPRGREQFRAFLTRLRGITPAMMTVIFVVRNEGVLFLSTLIDLKVAQDCTTVDCDSEIVGEVIRKIVERAGLGFDPGIIQLLQDRCGNSSATEPFTLAHVTAVCHLLCDSGRLDVTSVQRILAEHENTLNRIINQYDVIGFVEDIPYDERARVLLPRIMKVISEEGRQNLAECLTSHFVELFPLLRSAREKSHAILAA